MYNLEFLLIFVLPIVKSFIVDFKFIQKSNANVRGYFYALVIPIVFIYFGYQNFKTLIHFLGYEGTLLLVAVTTIASNLIASRIFTLREKKMNLKKFSEPWIINRFYKDLLYAMLINAPGLIYNLKQGFFKPFLP